MTKNEQKYLKDNIELVRAAVLGTLWGAYLFGMKDTTRTDAEKSRTACDTAMKMIEKDILRIYKHGKRIGKSTI